MLEKSAKLRKNLSFLTKLSATTILLSTVATSAQASLTLIDSRMDLGANDSLDWSSLGLPPLTQFSTPISVTSVGGVDVTVDIPLPIGNISDPFYFVNGMPIPSNFGLGDNVLFTGLDFSNLMMPPPIPGNDGGITLTFDRPVLGVGTQIAVDDTASFTAFLEVFDVGGLLLDTFELNGTSSTVPDNSAIFLGVISDLDLIGSVRYFSDAQGVAIGINQLSLITVPEFSSPIAMLGLGLFLLGNANKFKQKF